MVIDVQIVSLSAEQLLHSLIDRPKVRRPEKLVVGLITSFDADDDKLALDVSIPPPRGRVQYVGHGDCVCEAISLLPSPDCIYLVINELMFSPTLRHHDSSSKLIVFALSLSLPVVASLRCPFHTKA